MSTVPTKVAEASGVSSSSTGAANREVIITGAAGHIGSALCQYFAATGARVHALDRDVDALTRLRNRWALSSELLQTYRCELAPQPGAANAVHPELTRTFARIGEQLAPGQTHGPVLVNNAGGGRAGSLAGCTPDIWRQDISLNLDVAYHCSHAILPTMLAVGSGIIINIGSVNAHSALGHPAYSAAKAGLASFTRALAVEYGPRGIRANMVSPGTVRSQLWDDRAAQQPDIFARLVRWYPLQRLVEAREVAQTVVFLASPAASGITGIDLPVDCGLTAGNRVMAGELTLEDF